MPVEERRTSIHGGLALVNRQGWLECRFCRSKNLSLCRHPRQAYPTPFLISKLGIAVLMPQKFIVCFYNHEGHEDNEGKSIERFMNRPNTTDELNR